MKKEEKQLLFKDLCARLPYGVKISVQSWDEEEQEYIDRVDVLYSVNRDEYIKSTNEDYDFSLEDIKPYLLPLSSMTDEQRKELEELGLGYYVTCQDIDDDGYMWDEKVFQIIPGTETDDWMNAHHFDYRGLIEKGLAIDATGLNVY